MDPSQKLSKGAIRHITELAPRHPVWMVDCGGSGRIVVKAENATGSHKVRDPASVMNAIDPRARTVVMGKQEIMDLRDWANTHRGDLDGDFGLFEFYIKNALRPPVPGIGRQETAHWVKMAAKQNLTDLETAGMARLQGDKAGIRRFAEAFKRPGTLEKLGEILAADVFNGNIDRFNFDGTPGMQWPPEKGSPDRKALPCLQNVGNVFLSLEDGKDHVIGLDSYSEHSQFKDWNTFNSDADWSGLVLRDDQAARRREVIKKVVQDLETVLGPRNRKIALARKKRLPINAERRIEAGMKSGAQKIKQLLRARLAQGNAPAGLAHRLHALGWN